MTNLVCVTLLVTLLVCVAKYFVLTNLALVALLLSIASELRSFVLLLTSCVGAPPVLQSTSDIGFCVTLFLEFVR